MFSKIIRLGALISSAVILSSCGGSTGQTETQQSTPEGLFVGTTQLFINTTGAQTGTPTCTENALMFVNYGATFYTFFSIPVTQTDNSVQPYVISASSGQFGFSGGALNASDILQVTPPNIASIGTSPPYYHQYCGSVAMSPIGVANQVVNNHVTSPGFVGAYSTAVALAGTFTYPTVVDTIGDFEAATLPTLNYDTGYQGVQSLATLAGTYKGTVGTSQMSEFATFVISPASVAANSENQFGVSTVSGTGQSGCTYTGTASPLFKGNGYTVNITTGGSPCQLNATEYSGLIYLDTTNNFLYSFSPNQARNDGLIFAGSRFTGSSN